MIGSVARVLCDNSDLLVCCCQDVKWQDPLKFRFKSATVSSAVRLFHIAMDHHKLFRFLRRCIIYHSFGNKKSWWRAILLPEIFESY